MQRVSNQQGPHMKQLEAVRVWVSKVESKLLEIDRLIVDGENEKQKLCLRGYCSKTCCSSYTFATEIVETLIDVISLKQNGIFETVVERVIGEPEYISQLENDLLALQAATEELKALKDDVIWRVKVEEGPQMKQLEQVKVWISRVDRMIPQFDLLIIEGPQEIQRMRSGDLSFSAFAERVKKGLTDAVAIKESAGFEAVVGRVPIEPVVERPGEPALGLERMLEKVWNWLVEEEVGIIGIYGMGGVGKTTLLTKINNRFLNSPHNFDFVIWVVVSKNVRVEIMQNEIAKTIGLSNDPLWGEKKSNEKAGMLFKVLQGKKFTLLLDDLWDRIELQQVGIPQPNRENKCKVLFTTRSKEVCGEMEAQRSIKAEPLPWAAACQLFQDKVGREALDADLDIPRLAEDVARECAGLPLALVTVGRAMACRKTPQEWKHAVEILRTSATAFRGMGDKVFAKLKFSYDSLPNEKVKSCLLYCTLFPEDYKIQKEELIEKWFCESFWDDGNNKVDATNEGYSIVAILVRVCLLEEVGTCVKMHDVIRDMCLWIACEVEKEKENYLVWAGRHLTKAPNMENFTEVRRISLMQNDIQQLTEVPNTPSLLTLFLCRNNKLKMINECIFQHMKALAVLDLSRTELAVLPCGISELVSLQYLNISGTRIETLPWELKKLRKLKVLNLQSPALARIPRQMIARFHLLQVLKMMKCGLVVDRSRVEELELLEGLKKLSITIRNDLHVLHCLLSSPKLSSCIQNLEMRNLSSSELIGTKTQILSGFSTSLRKNCFLSLCVVQFRNCNYFQDLTWLLLAPYLTELSIRSCHELEEIISCKKLGEVVEDDHYEIVNAFSRLQILGLYDLPQLTNICCKPILFPYLNLIRVYECPKLKKLPLSSNSAKGHNLVIKGRREWWDGLQWEDDATRTTFASCFTRQV